MPTASSEPESTKKSVVEEAAKNVILIGRIKNTQSDHPAAFKEIANLFPNVQDDADVTACDAIRTHCSSPHKMWSMVAELAEKLAEARADFHSLRKQPECPRVDPPIQWQDKKTVALVLLGALFLWICMINTVIILWVIVK